MQQTSHTKKQANNLVPEAKEHIYNPACPWDKLKELQREATVMVSKTRQVDLPLMKTLQQLFSYVAWSNKEELIHLQVMHFFLLLNIGFYYDLVWKGHIVSQGRSSLPALL